MAKKKRYEKGEKAREKGEDLENGIEKKGSAVRFGAR